MPTVLITGATGNLGGKLRTHAATLGWTLRLLDVEARGDPDVLAADLSVWDDRWAAAFAGADAVVHLAATPSPEASWAAVQRLNIDLTQNVYEAAARGGVRRLVFASSNWVMAGYRPGAGRLDTEMDPDPVNPYGVSKLVGERMVRSYHERWGLSVVCLRIGHCQRGENRPGPQIKMGLWGQAMWLSDRDFCHGAERAVLAGGIGFAVVNLMSDNPGMRWDIAATRRILGYAPQDGAAPVTPACTARKPKPKEQAMIYRGVFPVAATVFDASGALDLEGQKRCIDFMIDAGSQGICILANWSEQFALSDAERETVMDCVLRHVAGRVPVIVTTTHFATAACAERSRRAQQAGAAMVMIMPPYHGATIRVAEPGIYEFFQRVSDAIRIPIMIQDAPVAGTPLSSAFLARMAREIPNVSYFKIEVPQAANKLRALIAEGGDAIVGPWDGEEGITLMADLDAGATGAMTGGGYPDGMRTIVDPHLAGNREVAAAAYARWLPLINFENRQCGIIAAKVLMEEGGVIRCGATRHPAPPLHPAIRAGLLEIARTLDPLVLRWGA